MGQGSRGVTPLIVPSEVLLLLEGLSENLLMRTPSPHLPVHSSCSRPHLGPQKQILVHCTKSSPGVNFVFSIDSRSARMPQNTSVPHTLVPYTPGPGKGYMPAGGSSDIQWPFLSQSPNLYVSTDTLLRAPKHSAHPLLRPPISLLFTLLDDRKDQAGLRVP